MKNLIFIIISVCLIGLAVKNIQACSCSFEKEIGKSDKQKVESAKTGAAVFSGKVLKLIYPKGFDKKKALFVSVLFQVEEVWKGKKTKYITVSTANVCCICGFKFERGKNYLVYAYGEKYLSTDICTRTNLQEEAAIDLKYLRELSARKNTY